MTSAFDQGFRFSIDKATFELLYLPISSAPNTHVKGTIDVIVSRAADAVGAVLLGLATTGFFVLPGASFGLRGVALVSLVLIAGWIALALALRRGYVAAIYDSITQRRRRPSRPAGRPRGPRRRRPIPRSRPAARSAWGDRESLEKGKGRHAESGRRAHGPAQFRGRGATVRARFFYR